MEKMRLLLMVVALALTTIYVQAAEQGKKKNVLLIFADDAGFMLSAYNNSVCDTPNLDKLASKAVVIKKGYTSVSSCSPSRSVLLTGLPQHQNGQYGLQHSVNHFQSFDGVRSLPVILSHHQIYTGIIGKYHVAPPEVYKFDYRKTNPLEQVGRNITYQKALVKEFLQNAKSQDRPFFLYLASFDTHRGGSDNATMNNVGPFLNKWGNGEPGMGVIPDWKPKVYNPKDVIVPYFLPDTPATRADLAAMYTSFNRLDQGVGIYIKELEEAGVLNDTLILFTADNGIPFPNAKTNLYESGMGEPMLISSPDHKENWGKVSSRFGSTMDFTPTILDWFGVQYPNYWLNGDKPRLTGRSLLKLAANPDDSSFDHVFSSHDFHEITMPYPMRVLRNERYRLIHNINNRAPYPLATDLFSCWTFQDILRRERAGQSTGWFKNLQQYYYRDEWELFDLQNDPKELKNLAYNPSYKGLFHQMNETLNNWLQATNDPWRCMPHMIKLGSRCFPMDNEKKEMAFSLN